jgi:outer membrane protein OmpA-like peptidoglycan-associated protein
MRYLLTSLLFIAYASAYAQYTEGGVKPNIVPNPGFEEFDGFPIGWYYKGKDFDDVVQYWNSATTASPDVYGPRVRVPASWAEKGFGKQQPHTGQSMAGITVFGCGTGKPHCREYIQIQLTERLVVGQVYKVEFWVGHLPASMRVNNIGAHFSDKSINVVTEDRLNYVPQVYSEPVLVAEGDKWTRFSAKFTAQSEAEWMIIGNFFTDNQTVSLAANAGGGNLNFAYYYIDDVLVKKLDPLVNMPIKDDDLTRIPLEAGKVVILKNIYFESDKAELLPRSYEEMDKLAQILRENSTMYIEVIGHTDNIGDANYNLSLSKRRAGQVMDYLIRNGIEAKRLQSNGFGSGQPIAPNDVEETRKMNRRVEFRILKK